MKVIKVFIDKKEAKCFGSELSGFLLVVEDPVVLVLLPGGAPKDISSLHADHDGIRPDHDDVHPILIDGSFLGARDEYWSSSLLCPQH